MKMKKIYSIIFLGLLLVSCNDYLDVKPSSEVDREDLLKSEEGYADALSGVYGDMTSTSLYGRNLTWNCMDALAGYYKSPYVSEMKYFTQYSYKRSNQYRNESAVSIVNTFWSKMYTEIANLNSILETIDKNKTSFTDDNYNVIKGEALGLRAFLHFDLLRMFGQPYSTGKDSLSIPYVTELTTKVTKLGTVDNVLTQIINDLKEAKTLLANDPMKLGITPSSVLASLPSDAYGIDGAFSSSGGGGFIITVNPTKIAYSKYGIQDWHNRRFHFNYYAAVATLARAYLWKGDKANALAEAQEIINAQESKFPWVQNSNLTTIGTTAVNQDRTFATEQIFALNIRQSTFENNMDGYMYFKSTNIATSGKVLNSNNTYYESLTTDPRLQYMFTVNGSNTILTKFYQDETVASFFQERMPLIRLSEMYYIAAECSPDVATGISYLEQVRSHRGLSAKPLSTDLSQSDFQKEISKEYKKEFFGEGQMWYYYKRTLASSIPNMYNFTNTSLYTFDRPEDEDLYGGR